MRYSKLGGGSAFMPPPVKPPEDKAPTITPQIEAQILSSVLKPAPPPESFATRNMTPIIIGGGFLLLSLVGLVFLLKTE